MTIEEKAKAYDEALERARTWKEKSGMPKDKQGILDNIFPELSESEDERIRKVLVDMFKGYNIQKVGDFTDKEIIAWLEKQGQTFTKKDVDNAYCKGLHDATAFKAKDWYVSKVDGKIHNIYHSVVKAEPKFHEGDWIVSDKNNVVRIKSIDSNYYVLENTMRFTIDYVDKCWHLWSIQDAKEGDMLYFSDNTIVIFKELYNATTFHSYCHIEDGVFDISKDDMPDWWEGKGFHPTTKEQRDLLFSKMKEAGYEWDEEKKELRKFAKFKVGDWIINNDVYGDVPVKIKEIGNYLYLCERQDGVIIELNKDAVLKEFKHWDITDAKDGDVLVAPPIEGSNHSEQIFIFKEIKDREYVKNAVEYYCRCIDNEFAANERGYMGQSDDYLIPATKEQCDTLFKVMHNAGCEWDAEKKKLKEIEQKPAWSEEDENAVSVLRHIIKQSEKIDSNIYTKPVKEKLFDWLKSLKERLKGE